MAINIEQRCCSKTTE